MRTTLTDTIAKSSDILELSDEQIEAELAAQTEEILMDAPKLIGTSFKDYAETAQGFRRALRQSLYWRSKRGQANLTDAQAEALERVVEGVAMLIAHNPADVTWWNAIADNSELGKG